MSKDKNYQHPQPPPAEKPAAAPSSSSSSSAAPSGPGTTIGPTIVIRGKLKSDEDLVIKGRIDAQIHSSKAVQVENSGVVRADVRAKSVKISGVLIGNITAESHTEIASDGRVVGDMDTPRLIIADGAAFKGRIDMGGASTAGKKTAAAAKGKDTETHKEPASAEGTGLPGMPPVLVGGDAK
jgi:cytoskeletal protein CcmA (bactofilin family)